MGNEINASPSRGPRFGLRQWLLLVLLLLLVTAVAHPGLFVHFSTRIPRAYMDTVSHLSAINWQNHFLFREPGLIFNLGTFYPHSLATYFGPPMFAIAPAFGLFQLLGLNEYAQFNLFIVIAFLIGAVGVFFLFKEVSGTGWIHAFIAASIYIVFNTHRSLFKWLPLFTTCWVPWALLFFFRYLRTKRWRDLLLFLALGTIQFNIFVYLGIFLMAFFVPWMLLFALLFRALPLKNLLWIGAGLALVALISLAIYSPVISSYGSVTTYRAFHARQLLNVRDLFTANYSYLYNEVLQRNLTSLYNWFPGIVICVLFFLSGFAHEARRLGHWAAGIAVGVAGILVLQYSYLRLATILYFALLALLVGSHLRGRGKNLPLTLLALSFAGYLLFFFNLGPLGLPASAHPFSFLAAAIPYFQRMCEYKRAFVILVPIMAVLAAHGLSLLPRRRRWLPLLALGLIWLENFRPLTGKGWETMPWDRRAPIYAAIPRERDKVILELPFFGGTEIWSPASFYQSIYAYSTRFHWNFVVNGRDSFAPLGHKELARHALIPDVFSERNIEWLKRRHSVEYLIINWNYLTEGEKLLAQSRLPVLDAAGDRVLEIPAATVFRLREKAEVTKLQRTYSAYHLRHRQLCIHFRAPSTLQVRVGVGSAFWREFQLRGEKTLRFRVDPGRIGPDCELLTISFSRPVLVDGISLERQ